MEATSSERDAEGLAFSQFFPLIHDWWNSRLSFTIKNRIAAWGANRIGYAFQRHFDTS
jgi:hypothetical protein